METETSAKASASGSPSANANAGGVGVGADVGTSPDEAAAGPTSQISQGVTKSTGSFELVFSVAILALAGLGLDTLLGWRPVLTVSFAIAGAIGAVASLYYRYRQAMRR